MTLTTVGCGGGGGSGGTCSGLAPCGGALDGTWVMDSMCITGDIAAVMSADMGLPSACSNMVHSFAFENPSGTVTYGSGNETADFTITMSMEMLVTSACASALAGATVTMNAATCTSMQQSLLSNGTYSSVTCGMAGSACQCAVKEDKASNGVTGYTVSGNSIQYTDGSDPMDYCVSGTKLTERQVSPDYGNLTMIANFHRQ
jgi:hypothetical protein